MFIGGNAGLPEDIEAIVAGVGVDVGGAAVDSIDDEG